MYKQYICVAMRGRPTNNGDKKNKQQLEPNLDSVNTLTGVYKDNMILEMMEDEDDE